MRISDWSSDVCSSDLLQSLITRVEVMSDGPYRVEHDQSKNLATYHDLLCSFIDHEGEIELRQSEIASFKFPLKLTEVVQVDRSEERRVGNACVRTCSSRWSVITINKKKGKKKK